MPKPENYPTTVAALRMEEFRRRIILESYSADWTQLLCGLEKDADKLVPGALEEIRAQIESRIEAYQCDLDDAKAALRVVSFLASRKR